MISFSDTIASIRKDIEVRVSSEHILLEVFTLGDSGGFGCRHVSFFEYLYQKLKLNYTVSIVINSKCETTT